MSAEIPEFHLGLENKPEVVARLPLFAATNHLFEEIYKLGHVVGMKSELLDQAHYETKLDPKESQRFLQELLKNRITNNDEIDRVIRLLSMQAQFGNIYRGIVMGTLTLGIEISDTFEHPNDTFRFQLSLDDARNTKLTISSDGKKSLEIHNPNVIVYQPVLEGLNAIFEGRKKINSFLTASA